MGARWEYTILKLPTDYSFFAGTEFDAGQLCQQLNAEGAEGWELVSVFNIEKVKGGSKVELAAMKRPRDEQRMEWRPPGMCGASLVESPA